MATAACEASSPDARSAASPNNTRLPVMTLEKTMPRRVNDVDVHRTARNAECRGHDDERYSAACLVAVRQVELPSTASFGRKRGLYANTILLTGTRSAAVAVSCSAGVDDRTRVDIIPTSPGGDSGVLRSRRIGASTAG
jgi:hypothetical protein